MANDFLTLEEIGDQHETMIERAIAESRDRELDSMLEAFKYIAWCIHTGLDKIGVCVNGKMPEKIIQRILDVKKVKIEQHKYGEHPGTFIYIDDELKWYISDPEEKKGRIIFHKPVYVVRTNVR